MAREMQASLKVDYTRVAEIRERAKGTTFQPSTWHAINDLLAAFDSAIAERERCERERDAWRDRALAAERFIGQIRAGLIE